MGAGREPDVVIEEMFENADNRLKLAVSNTHVDPAGGGKSSGAGIQN